jgi:hypothetical protein
MSNNRTQSYPPNLAMSTDDYTSESETGSNWSDCGCTECTTCTTCIRSLNDSTDTDDSRSDCQRCGKTAQDPVSASCLHIFCRMCIMDDCENAPPAVDECCHKCGQAVAFYYSLLDGRKWALVGTTRPAPKHCVTKSGVAPRNGAATRDHLRDLLEQRKTSEQEAERQRQRAEKRKKRQQQKREQRKKKLQRERERQKLEEELRPARLLPIIAERVRAHNAQLRHTQQQNLQPPTDVVKPKETPQEELLPGGDCPMDFGRRMQHFLRKSGWKFVACNKHVKYERFVLRDIKGLPERQTLMVPCSPSIDRAGAILKNKLKKLNDGVVQVVEDPATLSQ